jgi:hypothetical protein
MEFTDLIANDVDSHARLAVRVRNDRAWGASLSAEIQERSSVLFEDTRVVKELGDFIAGA